MEILILPLVIGIAWVAGAIGLFVWMVRRGSLEHSDRLALLPLRDDAANQKNAHRAGDIGNGHPQEDALK